MNDQLAVTVVRCPHCDAVAQPGEASCSRCGMEAGPSSVGERATVPVDEGTSAARSRPREGSLAEELRKLDREHDGTPQGPDPLIGMVVAGRYRIVECIGRGGMGVVYKIEHVEIGKLLALKLLAGELSRQREVVRRFKREALLASRLSHPNTVQVFDFGVSDGLTYLVMELVSGRDLSRVIKAETALPFDRVGRILVQICSSLAEAHGVGIVHRDLKPENVIIARTRDGTDFAKVLDFGLAKLREATELNEVTGSGQVVGTPYYMAPEQIHGRAVDGRTDIYALGAVMYEALTGHPVFQGTSPMAVFTQHLTQAPVPLRERAPRRMISPQVEAIVLRALEKDPTNRFQNVEDLQAALIEQLGGLGKSSVDVLLNNSQLHALQRDVARAPENDQPGESKNGLARSLKRGEIATRDEVAAFHRKLARQRWASIAMSLAIAAAIVAGGLRAWRKATEPPGFLGLETEPNNQASEATVVPFAAVVRGRVGKRIDAQRSDRDFYRIEVPAGVTTVSLSVTAVPNLPTCTRLFKVGETAERASFCTGRAGLDLNVPHYRFESGSWLLAVMQDMDPYEGTKPMVFENVSDEYTLVIAQARELPGEETEPNDEEPAAVALPAGGQLKGRFGWVNDVDWVCAVPRVGGESGKVRWVVEDAIDRTRDRGAVLEFTPSNGPKPGVAMRLHRAGASNGKPTSDDLIGPWKSQPFGVSAADGPACLQLRLTTDPWAGPNAPLTPPIGSEQWSIRAELVP